MAYKNSWTNSIPSDPPTVAIAPDAGDFLIGFAICDGTDAGNLNTDPAGWTRAYRGSSTFDNGDFLVIYKVADGSETSLVIDSTNATNAIIGVVSFDGVDNVTPLDVAVQTFTSSTGSTTTSISITPVTNGAQLVFVQGQDGGSSDYSFTFSTTSGTTGAWSTRVDQSDGGFMNMAVGTAEQTTAGAVTAQVVTTNGGRLGVLFALRPSAVSAQPMMMTIGVG